MKLNDIFKTGIENKASDLHITVGVPPIMRVYGKLIHLDTRKVLPDDIDEMVKDILSREELEKFNEKGSIDIIYSVTNLGRFRINVFKQRGSTAIAARVVALEIPTLDDLRLPNVLKTICKLKRGLVLITGPTGSGKSTTLAAMINEMNTFRNEHIITIEDPIEYLHKHNNCIINQVEIGNDIDNFSDALRNSLRQDPDIILVGEMRDLDTISTAITAAETGHLVLSTVHTIGAAKTIDRIIDVFPPFQQQQIRIQLSSVLEAVISQQLLPRVSEDGRIVALEIMLASNAVKNLIREGKTHQIQTVIQTSSNQGMITMDASLIKLFNNKEIDKETLIRYAIDKKAVARRIEIHI
ncbi:MAG: type IV pilus twitching motility protein PilT [Clostridiales bacterium]|nr:type IV pilus twitching motility protein PilT [Clostridiales bacterium]